IVPVSSTPLTMKLLDPEWVPTTIAEENCEGMSMTASPVPEKVLPDFFTEPPAGELLELETGVLGLVEDEDEDEPGLVEDDELDDGGSDGVSS
ncbi:hypothetical protein NPN26_24180, partial [Vibrio parahaemolyticus]|nr:hypothetical protein [Vibrio parahaemolyticus]